MNYVVRYELILRIQPVFDCPVVGRRFMLRKLFALARGECVADNPDSPAHWEALLPGHLYLFKLKELLETWLSTIKRVLIKQLTGTELPGLFK